MSAVVARERRSTAGKRMTSLVGKTQEEDDAFWGHDTWVEEGDESGNESFRESDEDSEARVDTFDSDFDESESDNEQEEAEVGAQEELKLHQEERSQKRKHKFDIAKAGRDLMQKKKGKGKRKALMGDGINAGLILNFPPAGATTGLPSTAANVAPAPVASSTAAAVSAPVKKVPKIVSRRLSHRPLVGKRSFRASTVTKSQVAESTRKEAEYVNASVPAPAKKKQKCFSQEELLLEAATATEPENERWLLARKRLQQSEDALQKNVSVGKTRGTVVCKFRSRRGCLHTLTFPEMDHVPDIFARKQEPPETAQAPTECVITGKQARYRDPKTMLGYHDIAAFKELRRRFNAGEPLDQRVKENSGYSKDNVQTLPGKQNGKTAFNETEPAKEAASNGDGGHSASADKPITAVKKSVGATEPSNGNHQKESAKEPAKPDSSSAAGLQSNITVSRPFIASTDGENRKNASRKRKPSAKMAAAAETARLSPDKTSISNVIRRMSSSEDIAPAPVAQFQSVERKKSVKDDGAVSLL